MDAVEYKKVTDAIDLAITHIIEKGCDDIFKPPVYSKSIEQDIIIANPADFRKVAAAEALKFIKTANLKTCRIGEVSNSLIMKDEYTFRQVSWIDPFDAVKYLALCILLYPEIEKGRIPIQQEVIHSHRQSSKPGELFDSSFGYDSFRAKSGEMSRERVGQWKIVTDISNFFDRIGNHPLEGHLLSLGCNPNYVTLLKEILFFWTGDRRSYGVPIGSDASRIISEAALVDVDKKLHQRGIPFVRYVDDFRIFAETRAIAYDYMQQLTSLLADEGLSVNSKKTRIFEILNEEDLFSNLQGNQVSEHDGIDLMEKIEVKVERIVSGRVSISRFYREPGKEALARLSKLTKDEIVKGITQSDVNREEDQIRLAVKFFIYVDQDTEIVRLLLNRKVTSVYYVVDAIVKEAARIDAAKKILLLKVIFECIDEKSCAYPYKIPLLRLAATEGYQNVDLINSVVDGHKILDNSIFLREAIVTGFNQLDRARVKKLAVDVYKTVPNFVKRAIYYSVKNHSSLGPDQKRPLLKNLVQSTDDWFIEKL